MAKGNQAKDNHGSDVSAYVHYLQEQREDGEHRGIGREVSDFASNGKAGGSQDDPDTDNGLPDAQPDQVIVVVDGATVNDPFTSIQEAIDYAEAEGLQGATIVVGAGTYAETLSIDYPVNIVGEEGAIIDGSSFEASVSLQSTVLLEDGFSGGSISNLEVVAVENGNAVLTAIGETVTDVTLEDNTFDGGENTLGSVVYLNPNASGFTFEGNTFLGAQLDGSPLLGIEGDDVTVTGNEFGETAGDYPEVEVFAGADLVTTDVVILGNTGLPDSEISIA